jgi:hypothetical protein
MKKLLTIIAVILAIKTFSQFSLVRTDVFAPQNKKVLFFKNGEKKILLFKTNLEVNTDGSPLSYSSVDLRGKEKALNNICNGVAISAKGSKENLCLKSFSKAIEVFERFRDSGYNPIPGYTITWENVLHKNDKNKPCVINTAPYQGYFSSDTSLKNELAVTERGDCEYKNQVSSVEVAGLVLPGGDNVFKNEGVRIGDLAFAYHTVSKKLVLAVIYDGGPSKKLGEGSVYLNSQLLNKPIPNNYQDIKKLATSNNIIVGFIPGTKEYQKNKSPYSNVNIEERLKSWLSENNFSLNDLTKLIESNSNKF